MATDYLAAVATLAGVEADAWQQRDWDTLARLYMPLQEARRQARQRAGEGVVRLDLIATDSTNEPDAEQVVTQYPIGQLLVAGWGTIAPAIRVREMATARGLFVETFLAAAYPVGAATAVVVTPLDDARLPLPTPVATIDQLLAALPPFCVAFGPNELPAGDHPGTPATYARTMDLWERLHSPFLAAAEAERDPVRRMAAYRRAIRVDAACELAHQHLAQVAHRLARG